MKKLLMGACLLGATMLLCNCTGDKLDQYASQQPVMDVRDYFNGPIKAWGIVQNWKGDVTDRFDITLVGAWEGDHGTLNEHFTYYDGHTQQREWKITRINDTQFEGTAGDIIGKAVGNTKGNAVRWAYVMEVPVKGSTYRFTFDDWMFRMNDGVIINRSYLRKFGFTVAELTIFMQKQDAK
jgi:hypothetical protein